MSRKTIRQIYRDYIQSRIRPATEVTLAEWSFSILIRLDSEVTTIEVGEVATSFQTSPLASRVFLGDPGELRNHANRIVQTEKPILTDIISKIDPDDVFFDIGAHIGIYSCLVGRKLPQGTVEAFDPSTVSKAVLRPQFTRNAINAQPHYIGVSNQSSPSTVVGDEYVNSTDISSPSIVKIDVDGAEMGVIDGLGATLSADKCRLIYVELHPRTDDRPWGIPETEIDRIYDTLAGLGFTLTTIHTRERNDNQPYIRGVK